MNAREIRNIAIRTFDRLINDMRRMSALEIRNLAILLLFWLCCVLVYAWFFRAVGW